MEDVMNITNPSATIKCWVDLYSDKMFTWAFYKTGQKESAEDLVQDTFLSAVNSFDKFEGKSNPQTWLFAILKNKIADYHRKAFRNPLTTANNQSLQEENDFLNMFFDANGDWRKEQAPSSWDNSSDNLLDDPGFILVMRLCMGKLPANWNAAIQLKYLEEKKAEIICQELSIAATNYWQILHRAKLQLRKCLESNWFKKI
jgi:RNA polymerase sigma-70 factor (ECF subfamily)